MHPFTYLILKDRTIDLKIECPKADVYLKVSTLLNYHMKVKLQIYFLIIPTAAQEAAKCWVKLFGYHSVTVISLTFCDFVCSIAAVFSLDHSWSIKACDVNSPVVMFGNIMALI